MLKGYDKAEAIALILSRIYAEDYPTLPPDQLPTLIGQCVDADFAYMVADDIMGPDGSDGDCYYNNSNAFLYIAVELLTQNGFSEEAMADICRLVEDYMDFNRSYLEKKGLQYHIDERLGNRQAGW